MGVATGVHMQCLGIMMLCFSNFFTVRYTPSLSWLADDYSPPTACFICAIKTQAAGHILTTTQQGFITQLENTKSERHCC
jgi:hypothetical protein